MTPTPQVATVAAVDFTDRQKQVIDGIERGLTKEQIAEEIGISRNTVRQHFDAVKRKLGVDRVRLVPQAYRDKNRHP